MPAHVASSSRVADSSRIVMAVPLMLILIAGTSACAPPFSELQSARLAGTERVEITGSYGSVTASFPNEDAERVLNHYGAQFATGISNSADVRLRYERVTAADGDGALNVLGGGPKLSLVRDRVAFYLPIGFAFGEDIEISDTWQAHPTLIGTLPVMDMLDVNGSAKVLFPFENELETLVAFNVGLGIGEFDGFVVRPEFGILINPGEDGHFRQFSIGVTYFTQRR